MDKNVSGRALPDIIKGFSLKELPDSEIELEGEIPETVLAGYRAQALEHFKESAELPGFRKGHVPEDVLVKKLGDIALLEEAIELCVADLYPELVAARKIDVIGKPEVRITKLVPGNPAGVVIKTAVFPAVTLPDYKKLSRGIKADAPREVTDKELQDATEAIRKSAGNLPAGKKEESGELEIPELTDAFVQGIGDFKDVADFKEKIRAHLASEKVRAAKEKRRGAISDALIEKVKVAVPGIFVESELQKILGQLREDVGRMGMSFEDYLKRVNKTEDQVRGDFKESARKRAILQLSLNAIAEKEAIKIDAEDVKKEAEHLIEHFKGADRERVYIYVESVMRNEKVFELLEAEQ